MREESSSIGDPLDEDLSDFVEGGLDFEPRKMKKEDGSRSNSVVVGGDIEGNEFDDYDNDDSGSVENNNQGNRTSFLKDSWYIFKELVSGGAAKGEEDSDEENDDDDDNEDEEEGYKDSKQKRKSKNDPEAQKGKRESKSSDEVSELTSGISFHRLSTDSNEEEEEKEITWKTHVKFFFSHIFVPLYMFIVIVGSIASQDSSPALIDPDSTQCQDLNESTTLSAGWRFALSLIPFMMVVDGILGLGMSSRIVAPVTLLVTILIGLFLFDNVGWLADNDFVTTTGIIILTLFERLLWTFFDYCLNVVAAFFFLEVVERWGVVRSLQDKFEILGREDPAKLIIVVAFCFAILIATVAPGGSNFLIAGSILIKMNIGKETTEEGKLKQGTRIAAICLFGNGLTSAFNLVGVCIIALAEDVSEVLSDELWFPCDVLDQVCARKQIGFHFSVQFFIFCVASPIIMVWLFTNSFRGLLKKNLILLIGCGTVYGLVQIGTALLLGPELPCLTSAGAAFVFYVAYMFLPQKIRDYRSGASGNDNGEDSMSFRQYLREYSFTLPFVLLMGLLFLVRLLDFYLRGGNSPGFTKFVNPTLMNIQSSCEVWKRTFPWLAHSGMVVFVCSLLTPLLVPYRSAELDRTKKHKPHQTELHEESGYTWRRRYRKIMKASMIEAVKESKPILIAIAAYASLAKVMTGFEMSQTIAQALANAMVNTPNAFSFVSPVIGFLGSALTGSTTTSGFLFGRLQVQTALDLGLVAAGKGSVWAVGGVQILGSSAGEIISPMNAVFSSVLLSGAVPESEIIKLVLKVWAIWMISCMLVSFVALSVAFPLYQ